MFKLKAPLSPLQNKLKEAGDQVPYAMSLALNSTAWEARKDMRAYMPKVFAGPVPFTMNGVLYDKSTKRDLKAHVFLRREVARYLEPQIEGADRNEKGIEVGLKKRRLFTRGGIPRDTYFIPTSSYRRGRGGNITKATARKILTETKKRDGKFFLFQDDATKRIMVYEKMARGRLRPALVGVDTPKYKKRLEFIETLQRSVAKTFDKALNNALDKALPDSN